MQIPTRAHTCGNGLSVLLRPCAAHPVVSLQIWVRTGSMQEGSHLGSGLSHLLEHMVFKGTRNHTGQQLAEQVQALGGHWNAYTSTDRTVYHIDGPAEAWETFLELLAELVYHPTFPAEEFDKEKEVIRREMAMYQDDPGDLAYRTLIGTLYKRSPRKLPVLGEREAFDRLTRQDMLDYHAARYTPNNTFITIAGDIDPEAAIRKITALTQHLSPADPAFLPPVPEPRQWGCRTERREYAQPTSTLMLAWRIPDAQSPEAAPLAILSHILGTGRTALLYRNLHDRQGIAYDISTTIIPGKGEEGAFVIEADVDRQQRDTLRGLILQEITAITETDLREGIARAVKQIQSARLQQISTANGLASETALSWFHTGNTGLMQEWHEALARVTAENLQTLIRTYFGTERLTEISIDPTGTNPPSTAAEETAARPQLHTHTLANGLRIILRPDMRLPLVHACIAFGAGSPTETEQTAGINTLLGECLLKGTESRNSEEIAAALENLGGSINTSTGNNTLTVSTRCLSDDIGTAIDLMADICIRPTFPADALENEREAMIADARDILEDPPSLAFQNLRRQCYGTASYGNPTGGTPESLSGITRQHIIDQHARILCAENAVLCITGDIDPELILTHIREHLSGMPAGSRPSTTPTPPQTAGDTAFVLDKEQAVLAVALPGAPVTSPDFALASLLNEWCQDMAGPVFTEIRERLGLAYYASSTQFCGIDAGNIVYYLGTSPEQLPAARKALEQLLDRIAQTGITPEELERTRATALSALLIARQSNKRICSSIAVDTLLGLPSDYFEQHAERIRHIGHADMQTYIRRTLSPQTARTWVTVAPAP